jgi:hypothetical protein
VTHSALSLILVVSFLTTDAIAQSSAPASLPASQAVPPPAEQSASAKALATVLAWCQNVTVHGYADIYYAFNFNQPDDRANFIPGTGTSAKRHNEFGLNLVALDVALNPEPFGFHLAINFGTGTEILHAGEPMGTGIGPDVWKLIQQATIAGKIPIGRGLVLEAGIMPAFIGGEVLPSKDNWNYTRSWMAELSPYYLMGARVAYAFSDQWAAQLLVLNGWQLIGDNNNAKSLGAQVSYASEKLNLYFNFFAGPELPGDDTHWRLFGDVVAIVRPLSWLQLQLAADFGDQMLPGGAHALWYAGSLYARVQPLDWFAVAARGEVYRDERGIISGTSQTLSSGTLTLEFRPTGFLILKLEGRYDRSTAAVFGTKNRDEAGTIVPTRDQALVVLGAVAYF